MYVLPPDSYEYQHPEGTGKGTPPFFSAWFLGGFRSKVRQDRSRNEGKKKSEGSKTGIEEGGLTER